MVNGDLSSILRLPTRRQILQAASALVVQGALPTLSRAETGPTVVTRLSTGWEYHHGNLGGIWEVWRDKAAAANVTWIPVVLPHCFNAWDAVDPDQEYYEGPGWYRTTLKLANPFPQGRTLLHFEAAAQKAEVFVGSESVGRHVGGYDEFTIDITDTAAKYPDGVPLAVVCDNARDLETIPSDQSDFVRHGGLYRHVNLIYAPAISVERLHVQSSTTAEEASISLRARLWDPGERRGEIRVHAQIVDPGGKTVAESSQTLAAWNDAREVASFRLTSPELWHPRSPRLYRAVLTVETPHGKQTVEERFGLRFFEFPEHGTFSLNGEKLFLRGTQRHHDHAGVGAAMTDEMIRRELTLIKEMGSNFVRLGHYQQSRQVLDLCDELGLVVWEEIPWCRGGVGGPAYREQARRMLRNMIDQHRNHPSIVFWGLGNENDWPGDFPVFDKRAVRELMVELNAIAHAADPSRMTAIRRCPFAADVPDVYSPSIWAGWYGGRYTEYKSAAEKEVKKVARMLHMEWGGDSLAGRHAEDPDQVTASIATGQGVEEKERAYLPTGGQERASKDGDWSESYICNLFDWHLKEQETMGWLAGSAQWAFKDFATPVRPDNPVPRVNQKGVAERDLTLKEGYYVFQSYWAERPMVHVYGHTWPVRWGGAGENKLVKVYSNCAEVELFVNGKSCGIRQRKSQDFPAAGLRWMVPFRPGENQIAAVAHQGGAEIRDEIRFHYQTGKWGSPARFAIQELGRSADVTTVEVRLLDAAGMQCLDARHAVRFAVAGDGELIQNLGTAGGSRKVELANGRAVVRVRATQGTAVLSVSSDGVPTAIRTLCAAKGSSESC